MNPTANDDRLDPSRAEAPAGEEPGSEDDLRSQLAEAQASADRHRDDYLRVIAELDNLRKRTAREIELAQRYAVEKFAGDLLEARDSLERGLAAVGDGPSSVVEGLRATLRLVDKAFERAGVTTIDPQGQAFDPQLHEAMATIEAAELPPGSVGSVIQKGYLLNGRVLRPARVLVVRQPST